MKKKINKLFLAVVFSLLIFGFIYFIFFTTFGARLVVFRVLSVSLGAKNYSFHKIEGNLFKQLTIRELEIRQLQVFPEVCVLHIQKLDLYFSKPRMRDINIEVYNGRIILPESGIFLFDGIYQDGRLDFDIYAKDISMVSWAGHLPPGAGQWKDIRGILDRFECKITGKPSAPAARGIFLLGSLINENYILNNVFGHFRLEAKNLIKTQKSKLLALAREDSFKNPELDGDIILEKGAVVLPHCSVFLEHSKINFSGDYKVPAFDLKGRAKIEKTNIFINLKGNVNTPVFKLTSEPSFSQERLMIMLLTGKSWASADKLFAGGEVSADLVKDFFDFFVLGGNAAKWTQRLGISEISLHYDAGKMGVGIYKDITEKASVCYSIDQMQSYEQNQNLTQKIGVVYKVMDKVSIEGEKEMKPQGSATNQTQVPLSDDAVFIKYDSKF